MCAPHKYAHYKHYEQEDGDLLEISAPGSQGIVSSADNIGVALETISLHMFDQDDDVEFLYTISGYDSDGNLMPTRTYIYQAEAYFTDDGLTPINFNYSHMEERPSGTVLVSHSGQVMPVGPSPLRLIAAASVPQASQPSQPRVDTVHHYTHRVDTVFQIVENRIYVDGNVDTVVNEQRIVEERVTRDSIFMVTRQIDSVYLIGGQYWADNNAVTSTNLIVTSEFKAFPVPATDNLTITYKAEQISQGTRLNVYDVQGNRLESIPLTYGQGDIALNVRGYDAGVYVYMLLSNNQKSATQKFVVQ